MARAAPVDFREVAGDATRSAAGLALRHYPFRPYLSGGSLTIDPRSRTVLAVDRDAGTLAVLAAATARLERVFPVCAAPEQVAASPGGRAFVTCRGERALVSVGIDGSDPRRAVVGAEPFGVALSPDGRTVLVTTTLDPHLVALDARSLELLWTVALPEHPRGVAVSPDGRQAIVAHLTGGRTSAVDLERHVVRDVRLPDQRDGWPSELEDGQPLDDLPVRVAGGAFAAVVSPGGTRAFVPYVLKTDGNTSEVTFSPGCYGSGVGLPLAPSVAAVDLRRLEVQRPMPRDLPSERWVESSADIATLVSLGVVRAAVHDPVSSRLLVLGEGSGVLQAFDTSKADPTAAPMRSWQLGAAGSGLAVDRTGRRAFVLLPFEHEVAVVNLAARGGEGDPIVARVTVGRDVLPAQVALGRRLFHAANDLRIAGVAGVACTSCHFEGREDGVTWRLDGQLLQTPMLAGRLAHGGRLRWSGEDETLDAAVTEAFHRLQGSGLPDDERAALVSFLRSDAMHLPDNPNAEGDAVRRGAEVFASARCNRCHRPDQDFTDGQVHGVRGGRFRTPSLRGVFLTAPYLHDGIARSLAELLGDHDGHDNPMAVGGRLPPADLEALERYLRTL